MIQADFVVSQPPWVSPDPCLSMGKREEAGRARAGASPSLSDQDGAGWESGGHDSSRRPQQIPGDVQEVDPPSCYFSKDIQPIPLTSPHSRQG